MWHKKDIRTIICRIYKKRSFSVPLTLDDKESGIFYLVVEQEDNIYDEVI